MPKSRLIAPVAPINSRHLAFTPIGLEAARLTAGPWSNWQQANREVTTPHTFAWLEKDGTIDNLRRLDPAAQLGPRRGLWFTDSDLYKALEAVAWDASHDETDETPDEVALLDEIGAIIAAAQESDGYINSFVQAGLDVRWDNLVQSHELYCIGHLIQAGIADKRVRGRTTLFDAAKRAADVAVADFADRRRGDTDGHPEIEMALVELYRETGEKQYLELAQQFIDVRGHFVLDPNGHFDNAYYQDATPVRDETTVVGHAVRAIYLLAGVVDVYIETGEQALLDAALVQWNSMNSAKTYLTGAVGSRFAGEAFGDDYELPPDLAYGETCATIGNIMLSWRLLLATGESRFADTIERALYNLFSASTNTSRTGFFYNNPAQRRAEYPAAPLDERPTRADAPGTRPTWFECACCPPNIMRTIATLSAYIATENATGVQVHQFIPSQLSFVVDGGAVDLTIDTVYPLDGDVRLHIEQAPATPWTLGLRVPDWATGVELSINGRSMSVDPDDQGYARIHRVWTAGDTVLFSVPMLPRFTVAHPSVDAVRGAVAVERGPVVYAFESCDQKAGVDLNSAEIDLGATITESIEHIAGQQTVVLRTTGVARDDSAWEGVGWRSLEFLSGPSGTTTELTLIPYALWANRGPSVMRIFIPVAARAGAA